MRQCGIEPIYIQPILVKNDKVILNVKKIQLMILKSYTFVIVTKTTTTNFSDLDTCWLANYSQNSISKI